MKMNNERGVALIVSLMVVVFLLGFSAIFILNAVQDNRYATRERSLMQAFGYAEAGANLGMSQLDTIINTYVLNTIAGTNPSTVINVTTADVTSGESIAWLIYAAKNSGVAALTLNGTNAQFIQSSTTYASGSYNYNLIISEKSNPVTVSSDIWDFLYNYKIQATGTSSTGLTNTTTLNGDFTIRIQRDNFAKYALFTNSQVTETGAQVWFTDKTNFAGPLHTNDRFNFYGNPSGTFEDPVQQHQQTARFYNGGSSVLMDANANGTTDVPTFNAGFTRNVGTVTLSSPTNKQDMIDQATANNTYASNGIYIPATGSSLTGGIYVKGNADVNLDLDGSGNQRYTIVQGGTTKYITLNRSTNQTTVQTGAGSPTTYNGLPDGVDDVGTIVYVDGQITDLHGTVKGNEQTTVASTSDIIIKNNVTYQNYTAAVGTPGTAGYTPPSADGYDNLLGIVSWEGDVRVGTTAPNNITIHGTVLASGGVMKVDNYDDTGVGSRGTATILGGVITDNYGAFGQFNSSSGNQVSGYGRNFVYDQRMAVGSAPPYFPTLNTFVAFTNDITDKLIWQGGNF